MSRSVGRHTQGSLSVQAELLGFIRRGSMTFATAILAFLVLAVPAQAATPEHHHLETFGSANQPSFGEAAGMAVDQSSGDLLVIDLEDQTLHRYHEDGTPANFSALSGNVIDGHAGGADATPQEEILSTEGDSAEAQVAVAPAGAAGATAGDIYVTDAFNGVVDVFAPSGAYLTQLSGVYPCGVAVDPDGNVFVGDYETNRVYKFVPSVNGSPPPPTTYAKTGEYTTTHPCQVAAGAGAVFAMEYGGKVTKIDSEGAHEGETKYIVSSDSHKTVSVDPGSGHLFAASGEEIVEYHVGAPAASVVATINTDNVVFGVAVNGATGNVYDANLGGEKVEVYGPLVIGAPPSVENNPEGAVTSTTAVLNGHVNNNGDPAGSACSFEVALAADTGFSSPVKTQPCVPTPVTGSTSTAVTATVTGLSPATSYIYRVVATNTGDTSKAAPPEAFTTDTAAPTISEQRALDVERTSATLSAKVNPNGLPTTYHFEYLDDADFQSGGFSNPATIVTTESTSIGAGNTPIAVQQPIEGLQAATTYHFRLVATNSIDTTEGPDHTFQTLNEGGLPDNRGYELVSPADKRPVGFVTRLFPLQLGIQAADDGQSVVYELINGLADASAGGEVRYLATRHEDSWDSTQVSAPSLIPTPRQGLRSSPSWVRFYSPDLSCGVLQSFNPLTEEVSDTDREYGVANLFRRDSDGTFTLITNVTPDNPEFLGDYTIAGATPDCGRVFFQTGYQLIPGASGLYEWDHGTLRDAATLPNGATPVGQAGLGGEIQGGGSRFNSVSPSGRFFFSATSNEGGDSGKRAVFVRKSPTETIDVSLKQGGASNSLGAHYETASTDGSHVFFTANYGLTSSSSAGATQCELVSVGVPNGKGCDLYDFDVDAGTLQDLSANSSPANPTGASVVGVVDASEDGSYVYFAARGQLVPGQGNTYAQNTTSPGAANVYLSHGGVLSYVATVGNADMSSNGVGGEAAASNILIRAVGSWNANATPDGRHLLFVSKENVTGYDSGGVKEAYRYAVDSNATVCVSCRPDGLPPIPYAPFGGDGWPPVPSSDTQVEYAQHFPRAISDDGSRIFFIVADALAPGAIQGEANLYEWENGQIHLLAAGGGVKFTDSGKSGDDVFLASTSQLDPHDTDFNWDLYDVRVDGGFPPPPPAPVPCQTDESAPLLPGQTYCQGISSPSPAAGGAASEGVVGPGNPPPVRPCKRGLVRKHGKCVPRKHHRKKHRKGRPGAKRRAANSDRGGAK